MAKNLRANRSRLVLAVIAALATAPAFAQDKPADDSKPGKKLENVVVTGTRKAGLSPTESISPIDAYSGEQQERAYALLGLTYQAATVLLTKPSIFLRSHFTVVCTITCSLSAMVARSTCVAGQRACHGRFHRRQRSLDCRRARTSMGCLSTGCCRALFRPSASW